MVTNILQTLIRVAIAIGIVALSIFALWFVLAGLAILLLGGFIYSKLTGKKVFHRTSYGKVRVVRVYPHEQPYGQPRTPHLIKDAVEVIDAETNGEERK